MLFVSRITNSNTIDVLGSIDEYGIREQIYFREPRRTTKGE
jgi:hypothetical protein